MKKPPPQKTTIPRQPHLLRRPTTRRNPIPLRTSLTPTTTTQSLLLHQTARPARLTRNRQTQQPRTPRPTKPSNAKHSPHRLQYPPFHPLPALRTLQHHNPPHSFPPPLSTAQPNARPRTMFFFTASWIRIGAYRLPHTPQQGCLNAANPSQMQHRNLAQPKKVEAERKRTMTWIRLPQPLRPNCIRRFSIHQHAKAAYQESVCSPQQEGGATAPPTVGEGESSSPSGIVTATTMREIWGPAGAHLRRCNFMFRRRGC